MKNSVKFALISLFCLVCSENNTASAAPFKSCSEFTQKLAGWSGSISEAGLYGKTAGLSYLSGRYEAAQAGKLFAKTGGVFLRSDAAFALNCMLHQFRKDGGHKVRLVSGFRSFNHQSRIWNNKYKGKRKGYEKCPKWSADKCARYILRYSSMPGTSRHHWGTDVDLDSLDNDYFNAGKGGRFYRWMKKNAARYGFCQPYTAGRDLSGGGYYEERWHWSFRPVSARLLKDWNIFYKNTALKGFAGSTGSKQISSLSSLQNAYVNNINAACR